MKKIVIGIDPGKSGAIVAIDGDCVTINKMPETPKSLLDLLSQYKSKNVVCYLEKVQGLPGMGGASMFTFGKNFGYLEMSLLANEIKFITVTPQKWQKHFQLGVTKKDLGKQWKNHLKAKAEQLFPQIKKITLWSSDALLIAEYGVQIEK